MLIYFVWPPSCLSLVQDDLRIVLLMAGTQSALSICCNHVNPMDSTDEWTRTAGLCKVHHNTDASVDGQGIMVFEHPCSTSTAI
jgi:hypothetical protein